jgi:hypothetical protein
MASIRMLKKDINFLTSELITQAYLNQMLIKDFGDEKMSKAVTEALEFRSAFVARASRPDGKDNPKLVKAYYSKLKKDMVQQFGELFNEEGKIAGKGKS